MFHNRLAEPGFHFLILDLKISKQKYSFIFSRTKAQSFQDKKENVSVSYFTVLGILLKSPLFFLSLHSQVLLILKPSP